MSETTVALLLQRIEELENGIKTHRDKTFHELCFENDVDLWMLLKDGKTVNTENILPPCHEWIPACLEYWISKRFTSMRIPHPKFIQWQEAEINGVKCQVGQKLTKVEDPVTVSEEYLEALEKLFLTFSELKYKFGSQYVVSGNSYSDMIDAHDKIELILELKEKIKDDVDQ